VANRISATWPNVGEKIIENIGIGFNKWYRSASVSNLCNFRCDVL